MTQADLNREVARATGESVREITQRGFNLLKIPPVEQEPFVADWDEIQAERCISVFQQRNPDKSARTILSQRRKNRLMSYHSPRID